MVNEQFKQWFVDGDHAHKRKNGMNVFEITPEPYSVALPKILAMNQRLNHAFKMLSDNCRAFIELQRYIKALQDAEKCWELEPSNKISIVLKTESLVALEKYKALYNFIQTCSKSMKKYNATIFRQMCIEY